MNIKYASNRLSDRHGLSRAQVNPIEAILDQILLDAAQGLIEAKNEVVVCVVDKKRLLGAIDSEATSAADWARRAATAAGDGNHALAQEAREREREHAEQARQYQAQLERQSADVERLKRALRILNYKFEDAKRLKGRISAHRRVSHELRWMDEAVHLIEGLAAIDELLDKSEPGDRGRGQGSGHPEEQRD